MSLIPPLFHENRFITDFKEKAELFNSFFSSQCSLLKTVINQGVTEKISFGRRYY